MDHYMILGAAALLVVAAACVADAEAQTNTQRIARMDFNTAETNGIVSTMLELLRDVRDAVRQTLDTVRETGLAVRVMAGQTDIIHNVTLRSYAAVSAAAADAESAHGIARHMDGTLSLMAGRLEAAAAAAIEANARTKLIESRTADMLERLDALEESVDVLAGEARNAAERSASLERMMARLPHVAGALDRATVHHNSTIQYGGQAGGDAPQDPHSIIPGELRAGSAAQTISAYHMKLHAEVSGDSYTLHVGVVCSRDIFVDAVHASGRHHITGRNDTANALQSGRVIYHSQLEAAGGPRDASADMGLAYIPAARPFNMTMTQADAYGIISGSSASNNTDLVDIAVGWYTVYDRAACSFTFGGRSGFDADLVHAGDLVWGATIDTGGILNRYADAVTCRGDPARVTAVQASAQGDWPPGLADFGVLTISNTADDRTESFGFAVDGTISATVDYMLNGGDLVISGALPVADSLLVRLQYATVARGSCTVLP